MARQELDAALIDTKSTEIRSRLIMLSAYIHAAERDTFKVLDDLKLIVESYPNEAVYPNAKDFKERLEKLLNLNKTKKPINTLTTTPVDKTLFKADTKGVHYYLIICPKSKNVNMTSLKNNIGQFNSQFFSKSSLSVNHSYLGNANPILMIKTFDNEESAIKYYKAIEENKASYLKEMDSKELMHYPMSKKNFIELFKNKKIEEYNAYFKELYAL